VRTLLLLVLHNPKSPAEIPLEQLRDTFIDQPDVSCLIIDDASRNFTFDQLTAWHTDHPWAACLLVRNPFPLGPGGNQKLGLRYAIDQGFDTVLTVSEYDPEQLALIPQLIERFGKEDRADYLLTRETFGLKAPWAWPRWIRHRALSILENRLSGARLPDWHGPMRIYRTSTLKKIAFELNTHEAHFHTEVLLQLIASRHRRSIVVDLPLRSRWRPLMPQAGFWPTFKAVLKFRLQRYNLFYDFRYHPELIVRDYSAVRPPASHYTHKAESDSPHSFVCQSDDLIPRNSRVLDVGCSMGYVARHLMEKKGCSVVGVDQLDPSQVLQGFDYHQLDLERDVEPLCRLIEQDSFDVILILDVLEHLSAPELFLLALYRCRYRKTPRIIVSTGNVGFLVVRLMLLSGFFNYGNKGILDITHKRLFTVRTFKNLLDQTGFTILGRHAFPLPWKELGLPDSLCSLLETVHGALARWRPTLFAYQVLYVTQPITLPTSWPGSRNLSNKEPIPHTAPSKAGRY